MSSADSKYNWNLKDIFNTDADYENAKSELRKLLKQIKGVKGKLSSCESLQKCYEIYEKILELHEKIYAYGMLTYHLDMAKQSSIKLFKEVESLGAEVRNMYIFYSARNYCNARRKDKRVYK